MKIPFEDFDIRACEIQHLAEIINIQNETLAQLSSADLLRKNTEEMLKECLLPPHFTAGIWYKEKLAGFTVLYIPNSDEENLALNLQGVDINGLKSANYKLCIVRNEFRGNSLQNYMGKAVEDHAIASKINLLCATASPKNLHSKNNLLKMGYNYNRTLCKYGFERDLYYKFL